MDPTLAMFIGLFLGWLFARNEGELLSHLLRAYRTLHTPVEVPLPPKEPKKERIRTRIDHRVAVHEAGHAVTMWVNPYVQELRRITIDDGATGNGHVLSVYQGQIRRYDAQWAAIVGDLGGIAAEALEFNALRSGTSRGDLTRARDRANDIVSMSRTQPNALNNPWKLELPQDHFDISQMLKSIEADSPQARILNLCYVRAKNIIRRNPGLVSEVTEALLEGNGTLDKRDIDGIFGRRKRFF